ncbi:ATPase, T2SS/T4P/T4SS family [Thermocaproicibacter melissae]|uniref:ATPase, T2SS/T4P/T4SS family n=1 Tax=Thermocaproicibacter melissae TaxID=2966552 RepID=UPI0024B04083|nr:ATPase, T2SS/T4P/T4SS family [Thermocaproicibacter melissae]WBY64709.1 ATPase, T2SS/T4P/T4SS family [Thermocaproicibacter melissae]
MKRSYQRRGTDPKYPEILATIQKEQNEIFWKINQNDDNQVNKKELMLPYIKKSLSDHKMQLTGYSSEELAEKVYNDLQRYSVLTDPLEDVFVEGISINSWNDIRVKFITGESIKIDGFNSPQHAIDIVKRLLQKSNQTIDNAVPMAEASIDNNIRITALQTPLVDPDVGVACYIRKLSKRVFREQDYLSGDFASRKELQFLKIALRRGVSILIIGKVNTGKTTFQTYLLSEMPDDMQIITIEQGAREIYLIKRDKKGVVKNNVVHLLTRENAKYEEQNITQEKLVEKALRLNPDILSVAEMRNTEAYAAQEGSLAGNVVISTTHAGSPQQGHERVAGLCRKKYPTDYHTAIMQARQAFPLVVHLHKLEDNKRRIMNISECVVENDKAEYRTLWEYQIEANEQTSSGVRIKGKHIQVNSISKSLIERMKMYGITREEMEEIQK